MTKIKLCYKIIDNEITKIAREEAKKIIDLSDETIHDELILYNEKKQPNIICLVLDKAKDILIEECIWVGLVEGHFGGFKKMFKSENTKLSNKTIIYLGVDDDGDNTIFSHKPEKMKGEKGDYWVSHHKDTIENDTYFVNMFKDFVDMKPGQCYKLTIGKI